MIKKNPINLPENKNKSSIDLLVNDLKKEYFTEDGLNYDKICHDYGINLIFSKHALAHIRTYRFQDENKNHEYLFILLNPLFKKMLKNFALSHELGHVLLLKNEKDSIDEEDADYFAMKLTGENISPLHHLKKSIAGCYYFFSNFDSLFQSAPNSSFIDKMGKKLENTIEKFIQSNKPLDFEKDKVFNYNQFL